MRKIGVFNEKGLVYLALEPEFVSETMKRFFEEISKLLNSNLSLVEAFYYASFIHLKFLRIHPFSDGNGRSARLLEKWFLTSVLGNDLWKLASEKFYKENQQLYYKNIDLRVNYYEVDYKNCFPFLEMLVNSVT